MNRLIKASSERGYRDLVPKGNPYTRFLRFGLLDLAAGESWQGHSDEEEVVIVLLTGTATVTVDGQVFGGLGGRTDVFAESATSVYVPRDAEIQVTAENDLSAALCFAKSDHKYEPFVIAPDEVSTAERGENNWCRTVRDILTSNGDGRVSSIIVGETINAPGNWSSYPPHKHDGEFAPDEANHEEIYFYKINPAEGFAIQAHYTKDRSIDDAVIVRDGDTYVIEKGYHPLTVAGGHSCFYLWAMAGDSGRTLNPYIEPDYRWL